MLASVSVAQTKAEPAQRSAATKPKEVKEQSGESSRLPVKRVVLYKNGVGYFEHSGQKRNEAAADLDRMVMAINIDESF
jgi:hypothetical protein